MPVKAVVAAEEHVKLDEPLRKIYRPTKDGKSFEVDLELPEGYEMTDLRPMRSALERAKGDAASAKEKLTALDDLAKDPARARQALAKWDEIAKWTPDERVKMQIGEHVKQVSDKFEEEKKGLLTERDEYRGALDLELRQNKAEAAILKAGGKPRLLSREIVDQLRMEKVNGHWTAVVVNPDGTKRITRKTKNGEPVDSLMGLDELVELHKNDPEFAPAFAGSGPGGAGTHGPGAAGSTTSHRISKADAEDSAKYRAARAAAAKAGVPLEIIG